jgi:hypothetical protein
MAEDEASLEVTLGGKAARVSKKTSLFLRKVVRQCQIQNRIAGHA